MITLKQRVDAGEGGEKEEKSMPLGNCILRRYFVH